MTAHKPKASHPWRKTQDRNRSDFGGPKQTKLPRKRTTTDDVERLKMPLPGKV